MCTVTSRNLSHAKGFHLCVLVGGGDNVFPIKGYNKGCIIIINNNKNSSSFRPFIDRLEEPRGERPFSASRWHNKVYRRNRVATLDHFFCWLCTIVFPRTEEAFQKYY